MNMRSKNKPGIGIVGLGSWGKNLLRTLYEMGCLQAACDTDPAIIDERRKIFPGVKYSASLNDILKDPDIKAVVISTPAVTHSNMATRCLNAGKDVFIEKPLALKAADGEKLVRLAGSSGRILMVGHILQYHPAVIKLKKMISNGDLGRIQYIYSSRLNIGKLRMDENILWSFAPHDMSIILMLVGESPVSVGGSGGSYLTKGIYDVTLTSLEFRNNIKAHIFVSWLHPFKEQKLVIVGSQAMAVFDDMSREKLFIYPHKIILETGKLPLAHKADFFPVHINSKEPLEEELKHFIECIDKRKKPRTDGEEGLRVLKVLEKAEKAIKSGSEERYEDT